MPLEKYPAEIVTCRESKDSRALQSGVLNGKLVQVLEKRRAMEAEASRKLLAEHQAAMKFKDRCHLEQLELMDAAHHR